MSRYTSFEDPLHDVQFMTLERRMRNLETVAGAQGTAPFTREVHVSNIGVPITSGSYVDLPGVSLVFPKRRNSTDLSVRFDVSGYANPGGVKVDIAVSLVGVGGMTFTDVLVAPFYINDTLKHVYWGYERGLFFGIDAGDVVVTGRVKVSANSFNSDPNDQITMKVTEVEP